MKNKLLNKIAQSIDLIFSARQSIHVHENPEDSPKQETLPPPHVHYQEPHLIKFLSKGEDSLQKINIDTFEQITGVKYLFHLKFKDEKTQQIIQAQTLEALNQGAIDEERLWLGAFHGKQIRDHHVADVSIRWIDDEIGYGLFAEEDIKAWEFIGEYTGTVRRRNLIFRNVNDYCFAYPTSSLFWKKYTIDALHTGNEMRFANHSDQANAESTSILHNGILHVILRSTQDIPKDTQITYDYTDIYWQSRTRIPNIP